MLLTFAESTSQFLSKCRAKIEAKERAAATWCWIRWGLGVLFFMLNMAMGCPFYQDVVSLWSGWMWMVLELFELIMKDEYEYVWLYMV